VYTSADVSGSAFALVCASSPLITWIFRRSRRSACFVALSVRGIGKLSEIRYPNSKSTPNTMQNSIGSPGLGPASASPPNTAGFLRSSSAPLDPLQLPPARVPHQQQQEGASETPIVQDGDSFATILSTTEFEEEEKESLAAPLPTRSLSGDMSSKGRQKSWSLRGLLEHNRRFLNRQDYKPFLTDRYPYKKLVIITCMDTRLTQLLPAALDLRNGDAKVIKVAGAMVAHPFGSVMRSLLVAVYGLGAEHILVVGHHDW
jgi:hypothetical protein